MARAKNVLPAYSLHKPTGQARVRIDGRDFYLGEYASNESRIRYGELVAKLGSGLSVDPLAVVNRGRTTTIESNADSGPTVAELIQAYTKYAEAY